MSDADFSGVKARNCKFRGTMMPAKMIDADLEESDLTEATFPNTDLTGAQLGGANLTGANLRGQSYWIDRAGRHEAEDHSVRITQEQLDEAVADPRAAPNVKYSPGRRCRNRERGWFGEERLLHPTRLRANRVALIK